jgi:hypothetical protein
MDIAAAAVKMVHGAAAAPPATDKPAPTALPEAKRPPKPAFTREGPPRNRPPWKRNREGRPPR